MSIKTPRRRVAVTMKWKKEKRTREKGEQRSLLGTKLKSIIIIKYAWLFC